MDFKQIEAFINVVRYKSFSKAADATFFTQPTISTHIRNLEKELGVKLLDRKSRAVEMTPQGAKFYKYAVDMVNARSLAIEALSDDSESIGGILEVQASSIPGMTFLPKLLADFRKTHPDIQFYASVSDTQTVVDNIMDRRGEIGFTGEKITSSSFECTKVTTDKSVLIAPLSYDIPSSISLSEAAAYPFVWRETGSATRHIFEETAQKHGFGKEEFEVAALVDDMNTLIRSVEEGLGIAIISERVSDSLGGRVKVADIKDFSEDRTFYMIKLKSTSLSPAAEAFWAFVKQRIRDKE